MSISVAIRSLTFSDETRVDVAPDDIVVLVGPNNAGKSVALREILALLASPDRLTVVLRAIESSSDGTAAEIRQWFQKNTRANSLGQYSRMGRFTNPLTLEIQWGRRRREGLDDMAGFFCFLARAETRLKAADPAASFNLLAEPMDHPLHYLYADDAIEHHLSRLFREIFDEDLIVNRAAGSRIALHCGQHPPLRPGEDRVSMQWCRRLAKLPLVHEQGDGIRSLVGCLLHAFAVDHQIVLLDEPEAFLHPPQARHLGRMLVTEKPRGRQLFVATHSGDLLRGMLDAGAKSLRVVRLTRQGTINVASELGPSALQELWNEPLLRHSNVLDGLFHDKVILCEGDGDCRFYAAMADCQFRRGRTRRWPDAMFVHCGGKARMPTVVRALRAVNVPMRTIADFDVLRDEQPLRGLCEAVDLPWLEIEKSWRVVKKAVEDRKPESSASEIAAEIRAALQKLDPRGVTFPESIRREIRGIMHRGSPWSLAKETGKRFVPAGDATSTCEELLARLADVGVFVVEVGELEGFKRSVGGHGPAWVAKVLGGDIENDHELDDAKAFVARILDSTAATDTKRTPRATTASEAPRSPGPEEEAPAGGDEHNTSSSEARDSSFAGPRNAAQTPSDPSGDGESATVHPSSAEGTATDTDASPRAEKDSWLRRAFKRKD